ncbi:hypothetical protein [Emcibacter sp.]|uniref:hypothetical protein n=1 Tax=Emcibacter sp. TaxID=1979954 RepID=UPI002AA658D5|nr:hypothetical protein [Emcibacter sp.]
MSSDADYVQIEWLDRKIGIMRVYDAPVTADQIAGGIPYMFFTVVQVTDEGDALLKGALEFPMRALKMIIRFAQKNTDWNMLLWERPSVGYDVFLKIRENGTDGCKMIKKFYNSATTTRDDREYTSAEQVMLSVA